MRLLWRSIAVLLLVGGSASASAVSQDVFVSDQAIGSARSLERLSLNLILGRPNAAARLERALRTDGGSGEKRLDALLLLCGAYFREQQFAAGLATCKSAEALEPGSAGNMVELHRAYLSAGPVRWSQSGVVIPLKDGQSTIVRRGDAVVDALVDSGAELGVVTRSVARSLGARPLRGSLNVGTTTTDVVGGLVLIDSIEVGNAHLENLTAVVLTDEQAAYSGLQLVVPLHALLSLHRMAYVDNGTRLLLGTAAPPLGRDRAPLYWDESGIGFGAIFAGGMRGVHFDSGSKRTWLFPAARSALSQAELSTRASYKRTIGGVGGQRTENASKYQHVTMSIAGHPWRFAEVEMAEKDENGEAARVGTGLFQRFRSVVFDFDRMKMSVTD